MFKKSLIAIAALGAFAGSAMAADITISGRIDTGLNFHDYEYKNGFTGTTDDGNAFQMKSGQYSGSRITIKGSEDLGNGMKAGFVLENGFDADDGTFDSNGDDKMFGREAIVYLEGDFGKFAMGRVGALSSGLGSFDVMYRYVPWGTGWGSYTGNKGEFMLGDRGRMNNTLTYVTPEFAGVKISAQYSLESVAQETEHSGANQRYAGLGVSYNLGAFSTGLVVDTVMNARTETNSEDSLGISWGASYDLGVTKPMILVQYGKNENKLGGFETADVVNGAVTGDEGLKGYAIAIGAITPLFGGNLYTSVNYTDGETDSEVHFGASSARTADIERWGVGVGYDYPLSKRTKVYGFAAYNEGEVKSTGVYVPTTIKVEETDIEAGVGLIHYF